VKITGVSPGGVRVTIELDENLLLDGFEGISSEITRRVFIEQIRFNSQKLAYIFETILLTGKIWPIIMEILNQHLSSYMVEALKLLKEVGSGADIGEITKRVFLEESDHTDNDLEAFEDFLKNINWDEEDE